MLPETNRIILKNLIRSPMVFYSLIEHNRERAALRGLASLSIRSKKLGLVV